LAIAGDVLRKPFESLSSRPHPQTEPLGPLLDALYARTELSVTLSGGL
jgi:hypothetical protein